MLFAIIFIINKVILFIEDCLTGKKQKLGYNIEEMNRIVSKKSEMIIDIFNKSDNEDPEDIMKEEEQKKKIENDKIDELELNIVNSENLINGNGNK